MSSALDRLASRGGSSPGERGIDIPLEKIRFDSSQPRKAFHRFDGRVAESDEAYIQELAKTIEENGLIQAITVQDVGDGTYMVVVGECRTRAHLLLGKKTIRAVVRNDLNNSSARLMYQIVENVTRQKLTDQELSESIQKLKNGGDGVQPMSQIQIAKTLGKSEGWVSRFVKYGDEELQRLWVKSGIADSVEHVYRLSILPTAMQVEILRRVDLPPDDPDFLEKPLRREIVEKFSREAKEAKKEAKTTKEIPQNPNVSSGPSSGAENDSGSTSASNPVAGISENNTEIVPSIKEENLQSEKNLSENGSSPALPVADNYQAEANALAAAVVEGYTPPPDPSPSASVGAISTPSNGGKYKLPDEARAAILGEVGSVAEYVANSASVLAPVNCRISINGLVGAIELMDKLLSVSSAQNSLDAIQCELHIPGGLAQAMANEIAGVIVDHKEIPAFMQRELSKFSKSS